MRFTEIASSGATLGQRVRRETPIASPASTETTMCPSIRCGRQEPQRMERTPTGSSTWSISRSTSSNSKRLAWQERKAEPFTVTPRHSGSAYKGFRPSNEYAGPTGITLGTAMAISGAAVSPNMGYYSSPSITLLLALFNVRLGWWLGNPGKEGEKSYRTEGPSFAVKPLIEEAFGLTTDDRPTSISPTAGISRISGSTRWSGGDAGSSSSSTPAAIPTSNSAISAMRSARSTSISASASVSTACN